MFDTFCLQFAFKYTGAKRAELESFIWLCLKGVISFPVEFNIQK